MTVRTLRAIALAGAVLCAIGTSAAAPAGSTKGYGSGGYGRQTYSAPASAVPSIPRASPASASPSTSARSPGSSGAAPSRGSWSSGARTAPPVTYSGLVAASRTKQANQAPVSGPTSRNQARSALAAAGPRPSPALQHQLDDHRQSSGPGFFTGAFVAWLLMHGGHSEEDRRWLERKLAELRANGLDDEAPTRLGPAPAKTFRVNGPAELKVGQPQRIEIHWSGKEAPLRCSLDGNETSGEAPLAIDWTPARAGAFMVECEAGKQRQRAMVQARSA
ncbi:hypothetical protein [Variovorax sp. RA8]|uniref:hypothetical protein n=1 Tax=Variovorax sp. (strain JCM 16519 / RA8) TaxID=662548 RepID=UPI001318C93B|nr:hypothetical protein [Variovorax sp. RA8]VTU44963.1 hypothetical protein RA8P2_00399 [Variovorax sp. RA8]